MKAQQLKHVCFSNEQASKCERQAVYSCYGKQLSPLIGLPRNAKARLISVRLEKFPGHAWDRQGQL